MVDEEAVDAGGAAAATPPREARMRGIASFSSAEVRFDRDACVDEWRELRRLGSEKPSEVLGRVGASRIEGRKVEEVDPLVGLSKGWDEVDTVGALLIAAFTGGAMPAVCDGAIGRKNEVIVGWGAVCNEGTRMGIMDSLGIEDALSVLVLDFFDGESNMIVSSSLAIDSLFLCFDELARGV